MTRLKEAMLLLIANDAPLREAEIVDIPFLGALAGCRARRSERRVASHTSEEQRRNAPARAAKNGILAFSASLSPEWLDHPLKGDWADHRECHIGGDFLLIYQLDANWINFVRCGTHSELFGS